MEWEAYLRTVVALVFVLALIAGVAWGIRRFGTLATPLRSGRKRRLGLVEVLPLDGRRKLVLVRRDEVEHLLLIGGGGDCIVERGIGASSGMESEEGKS